MSGTFPIDVIGAAQAAEKRWRVFASVSLAQWALESSWGTRTMGSANNCFGIKPWKAGQVSVLVVTHEEVKGELVMMRQRFCRFGSIAECFDAHGEFLARNRRYAKIFSASDGIEQAEAIARAGYATDSKYADKLVDIIERYGLMRYDTMPTTPIPREPAPPVKKSVAAKVGAAAGIVVTGTGVAVGAVQSEHVGLAIVAGAFGVAIFALILILQIHKKG